MRVLRCLELEVQTAVGSAMEALGIEPRSSGKAAAVLNHQTNLSGPLQTSFYLSLYILKSFWGTWGEKQSIKKLTCV